MRFPTKLMVPVLSALLLASVGCAPKIDTAAELAAVGQDYDLKWSPGSENSLLVYVPADSKIVFSTVRHFDASYAGIKHWKDWFAFLMKKYISEHEEEKEMLLKDYQQEYEDYISCPKDCEEWRANQQKKHSDKEKAIGMSLAPDADDADSDFDDEYMEYRCDNCPDKPELDQQYLDYIDERIALDKKYLESSSEVWEVVFSAAGLDTEGRMDAVFYVTDNTPVLKMTVRNAEKFQAQLESFLSSKLGNDFVKQELIAGEDKWYQYTIKTDDGINHSGNNEWAIVAYYTYGKVTFSIVSTDKKNILPSFIRLPRKAFSSNKLSKVSDNTFIAGYFSYDAMLDFVFSQGYLGEIFNTKKLESVLLERFERSFEEDSINDEDEEFSDGIQKVKDELKSVFSEECRSDYAYFIKDLKDSYIYLSMDKDGQLGMDCLISMKDKSLMDKYKSFYRPSYPIKNDQGGAVMQLSMDFGKVYDYLKDEVTRLSKRNFQCEELSEFSDEIRNYKEIFDEVESDDDIRTRNLVHLVRNLSSAGIVVNSTSSWAVHMAGDTMDNLDSLVEELSDGSIKLKKDKVTSFNAFIFNVDLLWKDKSFSISSKDMDISALSSSSMVNDGKFFYYDLPSEVSYSLLDYKIVSSMYIGTTDDAYKIHFTFNMNE